MTHYTPRQLAKRIRRTGERIVLERRNTMEEFSTYDSSADPICTCFTHLQGEEFSWWCPAHGMQFRQTKEVDHETPNQTG